jgi:hypothetical protein
MTIEEWDTLKEWLKVESTFAATFLEPHGFEVDLVDRRALKTFLRARKR